MLLQFKTFVFGKTLVFIYIRKVSVAVRAWPETLTPCRWKIIGEPFSVLAFQKRHENF